jgi:hypothetical protein
VLLSWSPRGFARYYELQVAADPRFTAPEVDLTYRNDAYYVWSNALPQTTYYWRVRTMVETNNSFVVGAWSTHMFQTVSPAIEVATPNGGEAWQRGLRYFVHWNENIGGEIALDLYKAGTFVSTLSTNVNTHSYRWLANLGLTPGNDYSILARSVTNEALFDVSDAPFNLDVPTITSIEQSQAGESILRWQGTSAGVYVEFNQGLDPEQWQNVAGPLNGTSWTNAPEPGEKGFFRLRLQ